MKKTIKRTLAEKRSVYVIVSGILTITAIVMAIDYGRSVEGMTMMSLAADKAMTLAIELIKIF